MIKEIFAPHSHDAADSVDDTLESTAAGIRTVKISLLVLADRAHPDCDRGDVGVGCAGRRHHPQLR